MAAQILIEQKVLERGAEAPVIGNTLVQLEIGVGGELHLPLRESTRRQQPWGYRVQPQRHPATPRTSTLARTLLCHPSGAAEGKQAGA